LAEFQSPAFSIRSPGFGFGFGFGLPPCLSICLRLVIFLLNWSAFGIFQQYGLDAHNPPPIKQGV
jgi:hypothetical protein